MAGKKFYIDSDEMYPVYSIGENIGCREGHIILTESELAEYEETCDKWDAWQERIGEASRKCIEERKRREAEKQTIVLNIPRCPECGEVVSVMRGNGNEQTASVEVVCNNCGWRGKYDVVPE